MAKELDERYATAGELGEAALKAARASDAATTRGAATALLPRERRRRPRLRPRWAVAGVGMAGAIIGGLAVAGVFGGSNTGHAKRHAVSPLRAGTLLKARGEPGVYLVQAGAKFAISRHERSTFFAGERKKVRVVSSRNPPARTGHTPGGLANQARRQLPPLARAQEAAQPAEAGGRRRRRRHTQGRAGTDTAAAGRAQDDPHRDQGPDLIMEAQSFRLVAQARSPSGTPRGRCLFFRITRPGLIERTNAEARNGRCVAVLRVQNLPSVRYSVHFYGYEAGGTPPPPRSDPGPAARVGPQ